MDSTRRAPWFIAALLAAACSPPSAVSSPDGGGAAALSLPGDPMSLEPSYVTEDANGGRSGRVRARPGALSALSPVIEVTASPDAVLISPDGAHVVIRYPHSVDVLSGGAVRRNFAQNPTMGGRHLASATPIGLVFGGYVHPWDGGEARSVFPPATNIDGREIAAQLHGDAWATIAQSYATLPSPEELVVQASKKSANSYRWGEVFAGFGTGAIAPDGRVAIALPTGRFVLLAAEGDPASGEGRVLADASLGAPFYLLSAAEGGFIALSARDLPGTDLSDTSEGPMRGVWASSHAFKRRWATGVHAIDSAGREAFRVELPFEAKQPAIDGAGGRIYVAGQGIAAVESGRVLWQSASNVRVYATAFGDGTLVMATGSELRVVDRGGQLRRSFKTPDDEPMVTPPAIGPDGAVWVATAKRLWAAR